MTELVAGFPIHDFSSLNNQNCDQGTILKAKGSGFQLKKNFPIWMEALPLLLGLETKIGEGLFSNDPGLGIFFRGRDHGKASNQIWVICDFLLVSTGSTRHEKKGVNFDQNLAERFRCI